MEERGYGGWDYHMQLTSILVFGCFWMVFGKMEKNNQKTISN